MSVICYRIEEYTFMASAYKHERHQGAIPYTLLFIFTGFDCMFAENISITILLIFLGQYMEAILCDTKKHISKY